jgi:hypothetical protein
MSRPRAAILGLFLLSLCMSGIAYSADFSVGVHGGYKGGASFGVSGTVSNFAQGFPLGMELGLGYSSLNPGDPLRARQIFINEADNGTPQKTGHTWDMKMEFLYDLHLKNVKAAYAYAGARYSAFTATFEYVGANEEFDVTSTQWGLSLGARGFFAMSNRVSLMLSAGFAGYFKGSLHGHDTTYNPDDMNVNAKENFKYKDANDAISTPRLQPEVLIGLSYTL